MPDYAQLLYRLVPTARATAIDPETQPGASRDATKPGGHPDVSFVLRALDEVDAVRETFASIAR